MSVDAIHEGLPQRPRTRPPRSLNVVFNPPPEEIGAEIDWSGWYLTDEEDMGQNPEQGDFIVTISSSMETLSDERAWEDLRIGRDEFFAWVREEPLVRVSPDVFVLDSPPPPPLPKVWETWKPGINPPRFALEIVSDDWRKDYQQNPPKYAQLGTSELVIFDPAAARGATKNPKRVPLQVFRRERDGAFTRVYAGEGPARSEELDVWLAILRDGRSISLRLARDPEGRDIVLTQGEARAEAERQRQREKTAREEVERQRQRERTAREEVEQKLAEALAELEQLKKSG